MRQQEGQVRGRAEVIFLSLIMIPVTTTKKTYFSFAISKIFSLIYEDICSSCELVQIGAHFMSPGTWMQLKIKPSPLLGALQNCKMMHFWVTLNSWALSPHTKVSWNWPCQMLAWWMNFHLVAFELVQLLPYRCLWANNSVSSGVMPGGPDCVCRSGI